jgi:phage-related protein (TIGR01555 family)
VSEAVTAQPKRRGLKINDLALAELRAEAAAETSRSAFVIPEPPPGVLPSNINGRELSRFAMDSDPRINDVYRWANGGTHHAGIGFLGYPLLAELSQRAEFRRPAEIIAKEMTRKWVKLTSAGDEDKAERLDELKTAMENFRLRDAFRAGAELDGWFGRSHIYPDTGDADRDDVLATPLILDPRTFPKGSLKGFRVVEPIWTYPNDYNTTNPLSAKFYKPQSWFVMGRKVHASRLLTFVSRPVSDILKPAYSFGGLSLIQIALEYVDNWLETRSNVNGTVNSFSKDVLKTDLSSVLNDGAVAQLRKRIELYKLARDKRGVAVMDKEREELANIATPLGTLDKLQAQAQEHMAAVFGIPLVVLFGITPSGLNASSDGEIKVFFAWIKAQQEALFTSHLTRALHMLMLHLWGEIDRDIGFEFVDLWELDETAKITNRKTEAETDNLYFQMGAIDGEEVRTKLARDESSPYHGLDLSKPLPTPPSDDVPDDGMHEEDDGNGKPEGENPPPKAP